MKVNSPSLPYIPPLSKELLASIECNFTASVQESGAHEEYESIDLFD